MGILSGLAKPTENPSSTLELAVLLKTRVLSSSTAASIQRQLPPIQDLPYRSAEPTLYQP